MHIARRRPGGESVRANDMDRAIVGTMLDKAYAEGELDTAEHTHRLQKAMNAKTQGELVSLVNDLQAELPEFARPQPAEVVAPPKDRSLYWILGVLVGSIIFITTAVGLIIGFAFNSSVTEPVSEVIEGPIINKQLVVRHETLLNSFGTNFEAQTGHQPSRVDCPGDLIAEPGKTMQCTVFDGDANYPGVATVIAVNGTDIRLNTNIQIPGMTS